LLFKLKAGCVCCHLDCSSSNSKIQGFIGSAGGQVNKAELAAEGQQ